MMAYRIFDLVLSLALIIILIPLLIIISILIKFDSHGPIIFSQLRIGQNMIPFKIYKFRTMLHGAEIISKETTGKSDVRITQIGKVLRRTKLDELPQLYNILKGNMSFVGPRPEIPYYANLYSEDERVIFTLKPGLTDLSSLYFSDLDDEMEKRGNTDAATYYLKEILPKKKYFQLEYLQNKTFFLDLKIIILTIIKAIKGCCRE